MKFEFYEPDDLDDDTVGDLWDLGVNMEDWDYMLFFESVHTVKLPIEFNKITLEPRNENIARLLSGSCSNVWYPINFKGRRGILGVAYHG